MKKALWAAAALFAITACSSSGGGGQNARPGAPAPPAPPLKNSIDFPLYSNASLISARDFTQNVQLANPANGSVFAAGSGTYTGQQEIAASTATFGALSAWLSQLAANPPPGYVSMETGANPQEHAQAQKYGLDYATFKKGVNGKTQGLLVIVMDPQRVTTRFGAILGMVSKYRSLPAMMREPIDNQAKARFGMSLSDATQPDSPVGAALAALDEFSHKNARGIVLIEALKK